jgi:hypothetical protein
METITLFPIFEAVMAAEHKKPNSQDVIHCEVYSYKPDFIMFRIGYWNYYFELRDGKHTLGTLVEFIDEDKEQMVFETNNDYSVNEVCEHLTELIQERE